MPGHRHFLPMKVKVGSINDFLPDGEELASCRIIFRLQKDQGRAVFADIGRLFAETAPADVGTPLRIVPIYIVELGHQLSSSDGAIGGVKRYGHIPGTGTAPALAIGAENGMRNRVPKDQSAE